MIFTKHKNNDKQSSGKIIYLLFSVYLMLLSRCQKPFCFIISWSFEESAPNNSVANNFILMESNIHVWQHSARIWDAQLDVNCFIGGGFEQNEISIGLWYADENKRQRKNFEAINF